MNSQDLKKSILQLALQGKLVEQREEEGTAKELLDNIEAEKKKLIKGGKLKKQKALPEINEDEIPFDIPESWEWVRVEDIAYLKSGGQYKENQDGLLYIKVADMNLEENEFQVLTSSRRANCSEKKIIPIGSIIFPKRGGAISTNKKKLVLKEEICIDSNTMSLTVFNESTLPYIYKWFISMDLGNLATGTSVPQINNKDIYPLLIPIPPIEEQKRIVAKIEELSPFVDKYDAAYSEVEELNKNFPEDMQKSILQYAIQGKLVEQRDEEGTADDLFNQIQEEKKKLIKEGKIKRTKKLLEITEDEIPFDIPESWQWVRLIDLGVTQTGNTPSRSKMEYFGNFIPFITPGDILDGVINYDNQGLSEQGRGVGRVSERNSILQVCIGGSIGKCAINTVDVSYNQQINAITPLVCNHLYIYYLMDSNFFLVSMSHKATGTATPIINKTSWESIVVPLPPLKEQKRIVAKIEELLPYTQRLDK